MKCQRENVFILTPAIASTPKGNMDVKDIILNKTAKSLDAKSVLTDTQRNANLLKLAGFRALVYGCIYQCSSTTKKCSTVGGRDPQKIAPEE